MTDVKQPESTAIPSRNDLKARAGKIFTKMLDDAVNAGAKREWNRFTGQIPSKNDVVRAAQADLRLINDLCKAFGYKNVWLDPDNEEVKMGKID